MNNQGYLVVVFENKETDWSSGIGCTNSARNISRPGLWPRRAVPVVPNAVLLRNASQDSWHLAVPLSCHDWHFVHCLLLSQLVQLGI